MSEYLTYILWGQREERMPHELERQRVVQERLSEQARLSQEGVVDVPPERGIGEVAESVEEVEQTESIEQIEAADDLEPEFANR